MFNSVSFLTCVAVRCTVTYCSAFAVRAHRDRRETTKTTETGPARTRDGVPPTRDSAREPLRIRAFSTYGGYFVNSHRTWKVEMDRPASLHIRIETYRDVSAITRNTDTGIRSTNRMVVQLYTVHGSPSRLHASCMLDAERDLCRWRRHVSLDRAHADCSRPDYLHFRACVAPTPSAVR